MESIRSGTTTERIVRTTILAAVLVIYSGVSFWDGYYSWPLNKNLPKMVQYPSVSLPVDWELINPAVTKDALATIERGDSPAKVTDVFGEPVASEPLENGETSFFFGPGGAARITTSRDRVTHKEWLDQNLKTETDLFVQKVIGGVTGVLGLLMVLQLIRVLITRVELSDAGLRTNSQGGMRFGGSPLVPWEDMTGLNAEDYDRKGWVDVEYRLSDGREGTVSLNDYVHKAFPEAMAALCKHHGWEDPYVQRQLAKQAEAARKEARQEKPDDQAD